TVTVTTTTSTKSTHTPTDPNAGRRRHGNRGQGCRCCRRAAGRVADRFGRCFGRVPATVRWRMMGRTVMMVPKLTAGRHRQIVVVEVVRVGGVMQPRIVHVHQRVHRKAMISGQVVHLRGERIMAGVEQRRR
uniref:Uncharacterized protein n=1 Tax=Anopheles christyi TaxID=43041 RepID=A0A182KIW9_9DIPT